MTQMIETVQRSDLSLQKQPLVGVTSVLPLALTYGVALILIFFVMGGYLPVSGTRVSSLQDTSSSAETLLGQLFQASTWAFAILLMFRSRRQILESCSRMKAMVGIPLLALCSCIWSQNPSISLRRGMFLALGTALGFYLVRRFSAENLAQIVVVAGIVAGLLGILFSVALPQYGRDTFNGGAWQGIFRAKNNCAQVMVFFLSASACFRFQTRTMELLRRLLYPIAGLLIIMSQAKTAWLFAPGLLLLTAFLSGLRRMERRSAITLLAGGLLTLVALACAIPYIITFFLDLLGKDPSMSGRVPLWTAAVVSALKRPLLGYGYAAFWTGLQGESLNIFMSTHFEIYQAQNGLLEMWLELGLVGVALFLVTLIRAAKDAFICLQYGHSQATNWYITLIALTVAYNVDESFMAAAHSFPWLLYIVACTGLAERVRQLRLINKLQSGFETPVLQSRFRPAHKALLATT